MALIVIEVETLSSGMPSNSRTMSSSESMATPTFPTSPAASVIVGVQTDLGGQIKSYRESGSTLGEEIFVASVGFFGGCVTGILAHGPQPAAVHVGINAAGEGKLAGAPRSLS